ncbi:hypothetical protein GCM10011415_09710 [Salipiger pallidus]|uniref:Glycosyltransferase subfamily 4-like N-terminal domain-containing protein n=1 Tax=Salipiger pallidus TaxID=1775170 RepID=A0A8J2ZHJ2_9RHOB|nr:glycosyltransferase family 4 protein [Salipiger pallidus]GGG65022.1 hypothetical protein GCM10011415_09710 [Salipiger pallidus]
MRPHIIHLYDDSTPGGVTRVLEHMRFSASMTSWARHSLQAVSRNGAMPQLKADMIVSHLALSWRRLPALVSFRARHAGTPIIHVEHSYTEAFCALNVPHKLRFFTMLRTSLALFDKVVAVSAAQAGWLAGRKLVREERLTVIEPMVNLSAFRAIRAPAGRPRVIGGIGRMHAQKGFDVLIDAFRQLDDPDLRLHLYGRGPEEAALRALAAGDDRIRFMGFADPALAMREVDLVAMPSRWEAFGLVALEARAAGRPVVCADTDGLRSSAGPDAVRVATLDAGDWARALRRATEAEPLAQGRLGDVESHFPRAWSDLLNEQTGKVEVLPDGLASATLQAATR